MDRPGFAVGVLGFVENAVHQSSEEAFMGKKNHSAGQICFLNMLYLSQK